MTFIGVATCSKDSEYIAKIIKKELNDESIKVISINDKSISNLKNVKFETILLDDYVIDGTDKDGLKDIVSNSQNVILNSDISDNFKLINNSKSTVITYGFNSKATISLSSVEDENSTICIQSDIKTIDGKNIEQQEKSIKNNGKSRKINSTKGLGILTVEMFYDKNLQ